MLFIAMVMSLSQPACLNSAQLREAAVAQVQADTANAVAMAANAALPVLIDRYSGEGLAAIARAESREEAEAATAAIEKAWAPVWATWKALRVAQDAWAVALETGDARREAVGALVEAYCALLQMWPAGVPALPIAFVNCEAPR